MNINILEPRKALNKAYLKIKPNRTGIESFKSNLTHLLDAINEKESEEFHKNLVIEFLKKTYYDPNHFVNTKGRNDLVIHNGKDAKSNVGVIIEVKSPINKSEMISIDNINGKALQELVLYYLRERITLKNTELKYLIVSNINEWFIFDAQLFNKLFAENKTFVKQFVDFEEKRLSGNKTDYFYNDIAKPFIANLQDTIEFTHFDFRKYDKPLRNSDKTDDKLLIALFKLLSPEHLLKLSFANDSNSLDKNFYNELLHIIGLTEIKDGGKKLIKRNEKKDRNDGSLLENAILQLESEDKLNYIPNLKQYGENKEEQLFSIGLELAITWVNRILFLKLLEAQLISYHKGDKSYSFLNEDLIKDYDVLNNLFFKVLAKKTDERIERLVKDFEKVPYLNSSLFEPTELERIALSINQLEDHLQMPLLSNTVIKDSNGKKVTGTKDALNYFLSFLDAYDFASEGSEEIQEDNKTLINASVLGLIFEKINGYKDGSFFTPSFITMYMCKETIRRAVLQKFNEALQWDCKDIPDLYNNIKDKKEANQIINSLKICDPAVGSGHFLVSALNEIIAIKHDLGILTDLQGKTLRDYTIEVVNDELMISDEDGIPFQYNINNKESQRIQETLFHEKQTIIENCLFGVDINPNSVKICRLRLWIELLKNAYYIPNTNELETLPNIDINIKCGNSLISRFGLDTDLKQTLKKNNFTIQSYKDAVRTYQNAESKEQKKEMEDLIAQIKGNFKSTFFTTLKENKDLANYRGQLINLQTANIDLFGAKLSKSKLEIEEKRLKLLVAQQEEKVAEIINNKIYENAFEWRFEFPEVLNDDGDFIGFDVVIGNPPYGLFNKKQNKKVALTTDDLAIDMLKNKYPEATGGVINAARIFFAFSFTISSQNGFQSMIIPYGILTDTTSASLRKHIFSKHSLIKVDAFPERDSTIRRVFEDVKMSTAILLTSKRNSNNNFDIGISYDRIININRSSFNKNDLIKLNPDLVQIPLTDTNSFNLLVKIYSSKNIVKIGNISQCLTGEIDMTFGKSALTENPLDSTLLKGVQLDRYILKTKKEQISQGEIEFVNLKKLSNIVSEKKLYDSSQRRIALQGLTGVNESRRVKANIVDGNIFLANSCNYLLEPSNCKLELLLCWLNSNLLNFVFKARSTSSNVNGYEIDNLPFCFSKNDAKLIDLTTSILIKKSANINSDISSIERKIDEIIYSLFNLTKEEIAIVENS